MADEIEQTLRQRDEGNRWEHAGDGAWRIEVDDGRLVGTVHEEGGRFVARVLRRPTGPPGGAEMTEAHGPTPFDDPAAAVDYVESNVGLGG